jgi:iron complex outermembrane receptor protein
MYLQDGVPLASQQWGEEHAPEIDPFSAEEITVLLGSRPAMYGTEAVGGAISAVTPLLSERPLQGRMLLSGLTNGRGGFAAGILEGNLRGWRYRTQGALSRLGTLTAPTYYLTGTASQQSHFNLRLQKDWSRLSLSASYSQYNALIGLFHGSHVGNLSDLERAIQAPQPLVSSYFTYRLLPPYQSVTHELSRLTLRYAASQRQLWTFTYARQYNRRSEWDAVGAFARAGVPALDLQLTRHSLLSKVILQPVAPVPSRLTLGLDLHYERNYPQYAYFIPRYEKYQPSAYIMYEGNWKAGVRIEPLYWIANRVPQRLGRSLTGQITPREARWWPAWGLEVERAWTFSVDTSVSESSDPLSPSTVSFRMAYLQRPPNAAELYAYGYHQGRAAFEIGDPLLRIEKIWHAHVDWLHPSAYVCLSAYYSPTFIYARVDSPIVWIRGASLSWWYQQAPALLLSLSGRYQRSWGARITGTLQGGALWASYWQSPRGKPLPLLPAPYLEPKVQVTQGFWSLMAGLRWVAPQIRYDRGSEPLPPPSGYVVTFAELTFKHQFASRHACEVRLSGDNLLNQRYRQYPDLMRCFADQMGRQVRLTISYQF